MYKFEEAVVSAGGIYNLAFGIYHLIFWKLFNWKKDLKKIHSVNRGIMQVLNLCLIFLFFVMAYVSIFNTKDLLYTGIGKALLISFTLFWLLRSIEQVAFFGMKSKISVIHFVLFIFGALIYSYPIIF